MFSEAVKELIVFDDEGPRFEGWLAVLEDVKTLSPKDYERLRGAVNLNFIVKLEPASLVFDRRMAAYFFAATRTWREVEVSLEDLVNTMPPGAVSPRAKRVAVWEPIEKALSNVSARVTAIGNCLLADVRGSDRYITCIDLDRKLFACTCPAYNDGRDKRHVLCKHLIHSIYRHSEEIMRWAGAGPEWIMSLKASQNHKHAYEMVCNWIYYFIKHVFAGLMMQAARLANPEEVREKIFK
ncbi:MAG: hypothetical protein QXE92_00440 [Thermofilaceae archaeon]